MTQIKKVFLIIFLLFLTILSVHAQSTSKIYQKKGYAIAGYDTVAYFTKNKAVFGNPKISYSWNGAMWLFSTENNKKMFSENPHKYAPQYGGYCAYALTKGSLAPIDPKAFTVYKGKLYLNYSTSIRSTWLQNKDSNIVKADKNWQKVK